MTNQMKFSLIVLAALIFLGASCNHRQAVSINGHRIEIEVAQTPAEQEQGLGGRDTLAQDSGMLFVFDQPSQTPFWMKDMRFDLDFIWIRDGMIVDITPNVKAQPGAIDNDLTIYSPQTLIDSMLEVNAGWSELHQIRVGDRVDGI